MTSRAKLKIALETAKDKWKMALLLTLIFMGFSAMYIGIYPAFEESLEQFTEMPMEFIRGFENMGTFTGYLNIELYQIFWILILPTLIAYIAASLISAEIEAGTIDMLMANPISRKQIVLEKFLGLVPLVLTVNFATMGTVYGMASLIGEEISFTHLLLNHLWSVPYFMAIVSISLLVSTIIDKKMRASITAMAIVIGMYLMESIAQLVPEYEKIGMMSLVRYYDPSDLLLEGEMSTTGPIVLTLVLIAALTSAVINFERKDIT
ncbi:MAG: ABC transporter permease [Candidatus Hadarchaeia archaeon]